MSFFAVKGGKKSFEAFCPLNRDSPYFCPLNRDSPYTIFSTPDVTPLQRMKYSTHVKMPTPMELCDDDASFVEHDMSSYVPSDKKDSPFDNMTSMSLALAEPHDKKVTKTDEVVADEPKPVLLEKKAKSKEPKRDWSPKTAAQQ